MRCRQCSAELPAGSAFCSRCGAAQGEGAPPFPPRGAADPTPESDLWNGRYALRADVHWWLLSGAWIGLALFLYLRYAEDPRSTWSLVALGLGLAPGVVALGRALLAHWSLRYRLTNHRLFTERGLLSRTHDEIELIRVDDVSVHQSLFQRMLGVGTVTVLSTDATSPKLHIEGVTRPLELKELIRTQVRARRARTTFLENL